MVLAFKQRQEAISWPCDMSRALFWLEKALSVSGEHGCHKYNKNIRFHVGVAYFIPRPPHHVMQLWRSLLYRER